MLGRPLIGKRASCFLSTETHAWLETVQSELGLKTKAEAMRKVVEHARNVTNIIECLKIENGQQEE